MGDPQKREKSKYRYEWTSFVGPAKSSLRVGNRIPAAKVGRFGNYADSYGVFMGFGRICAMRVQNGVEMRYRMAWSRN
jgi:hypothetical protein